MNDISFTVTIPAGHPRLGDILDAIRGAARAGASQADIRVLEGTVENPPQEAPPEKPEKAPRKRRAKKAAQDTPKAEKSPEAPATAARPPAMSLSAVQHVVREVAAADGGWDLVRLVLDRFGAPRVSELAEDDRAAFVKALQQGVDS